jgi:Cytochrome c1
VKKLLKLNFNTFIFFLLNCAQTFAAEKVEYLKTDWSFKGIFGKFDRSALQRGYQVLY